MHLNSSAVYVQMSAWTCISHTAQIVLRHDHNLAVSKVQHVYNAASLACLSYNTVMSQNNTSRAQPGPTFLGATELQDYMLRPCKQSDTSIIGTTSATIAAAFLSGAVPVTLCPIRGGSRIGHLRTELVLGPKRHPVGI